MFICDKNYHCVGCGHEYADDKSDIDAEYADCEYLTEVVPVVYCKDCKHLTIVNKNTVYAVCGKTGLVFKLWEEDTRTHFCSYGERKEQT